MLVHFLQVGEDLVWAIGSSWVVLSHIYGILLAQNLNIPGVSPGGILDAILQGDKSGLKCPFLVYRDISWG